MAQYAQQAARAGDQYLAALATTQDRFIESLAAMRPWVASTNPAAAAAVRTTRQFNEASFAFALKLLEQQHGFFAKLHALQSRAARPPGSRATREAAAVKASTATKTAGTKATKAASKRSSSKKVRKRRATAAAATQAE